MLRNFVDLFVPTRVIAANHDSFLLSDGRRFVPGIAFFYLFPVAAGVLSIWLGWTFLERVTGPLLAAVSLIGSVFVAVSAVLMQAVAEEAAAPGTATTQDRARAATLRNVHGAIGYAALTAFVLAVTLVWLDAVTPDPTTVPAPSEWVIVLHGFALALSVHALIGLLRVMVISDIIVEYYTKKAQRRVSEEGASRRVGTGP